jgi:membrane AbrB-like protein
LPAPVYSALASTGLSRPVGLCLLVAAVGAAAGRYFHLPGGPFTGALVASAVVRLLERPVAEPPRWLRSLARIVLGLTIGAAVTMETLRAIAGAIVPVGANVLMLVVLGMALAWAINRLTHMDLASALCACSPGVLAAMVSLAEDLGGNSKAVASMHLVRLISILLVMPGLVRVIFGDPGAAVMPLAASGGATPLLALGVLLAIGMLAAALAVKVKLPGGEILAAMAVGGLVNQTWLHLDGLPNSWPLFAQWIIGAGVGAGVTRAVLRDFRPFAVAGAAMTASMIVAGLGLGWLLVQTTTLDPITAMVGSAPGGAEQMVILAGELGGDAQLVAAMHLARQIILMLLLPLITRLAGRWSGAASGKGA